MVLFNFLDLRDLMEHCRHHQMIRVVHSQHPSFSVAVRLMTLWCNRNYFSGLISIRQIELLVASIYKDSASSVFLPASSSVVFVRALWRLGTHSFDLEPIVVSVDDRHRSQYVPIKFARSSRNSYLFILSDTDVELLTSGVSNFEIDCATLKLIQKRAVQCARLFFRNISFPLSLAEVFNCNMESTGCNAILKFDKSVCCDSKLFLQGPKVASIKIYSNMKAIGGIHNMIVSDPKKASSINMLQESVVKSLRKRFSSEAIFVWDDTVGDRVGVIFRPASFLLSTYSPLDSRSKIPLVLPEPQTNSLSLPAITKIVSEMVAASEGLVTSVTFR